MQILFVDMNYFLWVQYLGKCESEPPMAEAEEAGQAAPPSW
jgi:hypothetical protein